MVAQSFARLPFFADLPAQVRVSRPRQAPAREIPRMALPREEPLPQGPARRDLRLRTLAAELLSRG